MSEIPPQTPGDDRRPPDDDDSTPSSSSPESSPPSDPLSGPATPPSDPLAAGPAPADDPSSRPSSDPWASPSSAGTPEFGSPAGGQLPHYGAAGEPAADAPGQPPYGTPGQPPYGTPGQPPYGTPGQPPYGAPGQPPYGAAGQPPFGPPGYGPPAGYLPPAYGSPPHPTYGYGEQVPGYPPGLYAGPDDPLVSADFGGWWSRSFRLLATLWRPMAMVQLLWVLPLLVASVLINVIPSSSTTTITNSSDINWQKDFIGPLLIVIPLALLAVLLSLVTQLATLQILVQYATGQPVSVGGAFMTGLRRAPAMFGWGILAGILILVGLVLCILPGLYVGMALAVLPAIVLLERGQGIGRAFQLFHADFGAAFSRIITMAGLGLAFAIVENIFSGILTSAGTFSVGDGMPIGIAILAAVISVIFSVITGIFFAPLLLTAYADMRARREPFSTAYLAPTS